MSTKFKPLSIFNTIMQGTKNSMRKRNIVSVPIKAGENQEYDSNPKEALSQDPEDNLKPKKPQEILSAENVNSRIIEKNRQSMINCIDVEQISNLPPKKKLNFRNLTKRELIAADSDAHEKNKNKSRATVKMEAMKEELKQLEDPPLTQWEKDLMSARLPYSFFDKPCEQLAQNLLGKILVRKLENGTILKGRIVETESYLGTVDKASHTYEYKVSARNLPMYMPPGTIYVYFTYGMYHCFNLSSQGDGCAVLIRALEPVEGLEQMVENRNSQKKSSSKQPRKEFKPHELCNGPSKFCMAFSLQKEHSKYSLCSWKGLWIEEDNSYQEEIKIIHCKRIGIESCGHEWANKPLRYYIYGNRSVSKRDKKAEATSLEKT